MTRTIKPAQHATWTDASGTHRVRILSLADSSGHHKVLDLANGGTWLAHHSQLKIK